MSRRSLRSLRAAKIEAQTAAIQCAQTHGGGLIFASDGERECAFEVRDEFGVWVGEFIVDKKTRETFRAYRAPLIGGAG